MGQGSKAALVTGATGLLGRQVVKAFEYPGRDWTVKGTGLSRADGVSVLKVNLEKKDEVEAALDSVKPRVVVHCAANRFPDKVDKDPEGTKALNVIATRTLASLCAARSILMIYVSTDYVFAGREGEAPYDVDATPAPPNLYGETKLGGEEVLHEEFRKAGKEGLGVVMRVPVLYGQAEVPEESAVNVLMNAVWKAQTEGVKVVMDDWSVRYPTNTEDVARVICDVAEKYLGSEDPSSLPKILHFSSEDKTTKYKICEMFGRIMALPITNIERNTQGNDPNASVQRPYDCHLSTRALKELGIGVDTNTFEGWWRRELGAFRK
ncbi:related to methionine adenosyltransferase regulatory beta subunit [Cephalotrichum gorgonifer]|uniref:Related to methionine adenosyltransferase regulatory beta subunit n=1 Tax=Cephalotrichum gorgonifer TaxID=2041049 RepID=A0AAE8N4P9_9PEZI|nr:related to methionine adenosyltransferase regulatory beta subunit [Cephalotrichum gorgonifer]